MITLQRHALYCCLACLRIEPQAYCIVILHFSRAEKSLGRHFRFVVPTAFSEFLKLLGALNPRCPNCDKLLDRVEGEKYRDSLHRNYEERNHTLSRLVPAAVCIRPIVNKPLANNTGMEINQGLTH